MVVQQHAHSQKTMRKENDEMANGEGMKNRHLGALGMASGSKKGLVLYFWPFFVAV
jgi:hypothetical protein